MRLSVTYDIKDIFNHNREQKLGKGEAIYE